MRIRYYLIRILKNILFFLSDKKKAAKFWDETETAALIEYWWNNKFIREIIQKEITGDASLSWYTKKIQDRSTPFGRVLCFGDGHGMAAEAFLTKRDTIEIVYLNISKGEGERFYHKMKELNIDIPYSFVKSDANSYDYSSLGLFNTIIDVGAFHHFQNFEYIFPQLNNQLHRDGIMYVDEYVGLSKLGFEQSIIDIINEWLDSLPDQLIACRKPVNQKDFKKMWKCSDDPSEGIRSGDLDQMLRDNFELVEVISFGGTLLHPFFLTSNLKPCRLNTNNWHQTEVGKFETSRLVRFEQKMIGTGKIPQNYLYYVLKKK